MPRKDIPVVDERQQKYLTKQNNYKDAHEVARTIFSTFMLYRKDLPRKCCVLKFCYFAKITFLREKIMHASRIQKKQQKISIYVIIEESITVLEKHPFLK